MKFLASARVVGIGAIAVALAAGCAATTAKAPTVLGTGRTVNATLTDKKITLDHGTMTSGPVTFVVKNIGGMDHKLVVLQTDVAQDKIPANIDAAGTVVETGSMGQSAMMSTGETKTFTVTLAAGHYVLVCNEVGHYDLGMHMAFTVN